MSRRIAAVLIDLSGTIHIEDTAIPGAIEALSRLQNRNLKVKFVTNTTKESKQTLLNRLTNIGFNINEEDIFTSLTAARSLVEQRQLRPHFLLSEDALKDFKGISVSNPNAVVVGLAPSAFHYENLNVAFRLLMEGCPLIAIHRSRYFKRTDGLALGPGAFVAGLEFSTGCTAEVVGKPEARFFNSALQDLECIPEEAIMIGDDVKDDIHGAMAAGLQGILVKTGKYRPGDEATISPPPSHIAESFAHAIDYLLSKI